MQSHVSTDAADIRDYDNGVRINAGYTQGQVNSIKYRGDSDLKIPRLKQEGINLLTNMRPAT